MGSYYFENYMWKEEIELGTWQVDFDLKIKVFFVGINIYIRPK